MLLSVYLQCKTDALPSAGKLSGLSALSAYLCLTGLDTGAIFRLTDTGLQAAGRRCARAEQTLNIPEVVIRF